MCDHGNAHPPKSFLAFQRLVDDGFDIAGGPLHPDETPLVKGSVPEFLKPAIGAVGAAPVGIGEQKIKAVEPGVAIKDALLESQGHGRGQAHLQMFWT
jgi:hypothetical protein